MKRFQKITTWCIGLCALTTMLQSCLKDEKASYYYPHAVVTTKTASDHTFYLQLDDSTTLLPVNYKNSPYGSKEVRALVNYTLLEERPDGYSYQIRLNAMDSILTKNTAVSLGDRNDSVYGKDPVEIIKDNVTIVEDGFLTLNFSTYWGSFHRPHKVSLITGVNKDNPYEVEFRHHAHNDVPERPGNALVAFNLKDLPDTQGKTVKLKLTWNSFSGKKSTEFDYCTRKTTTSPMRLTGNSHEFIQDIE